MISYLHPKASLARDLAGVDWKEYKKKSELIFSGRLIKAELDEKSQKISYTYRVSKIFKGNKIKEISFEAHLRENINKRIGGLAIVALKKVGQKWALSIDERSCWTHQNEMKQDFRGFPIYKIPTPYLINKFPKQLGEKVKLKKLYQDGYHLEEVFVYPMHKVEKHLETYLGNEK